jgi:hypothetical protein
MRPHAAQVRLQMLHNNGHVTIVTKLNLDSPKMTDADAPVKFELPLFYNG